MIVAPTSYGMGHLGDDSTGEATYVDTLYGSPFPATTINVPAPSPDFSSLTSAQLAEIQSNVDNAYPTSITSQNAAIAQATGGTGYAGMTTQQVNQAIGTTPSLAQSLANLFSGKPSTSPTLVGTASTPGSLGTSSSTMTMLLLVVGGALVLGMISRKK